MKKDVFIIILLMFALFVYSCGNHIDTETDFSKENQAIIETISAVEVPDSLIVSDVNVYFIYDTIFDGYKVFGRFIPYLDKRYNTGIAETGTLILIAKNIKNEKHFSYITEGHASQNTYILMESYTANQLRKDNNKVFRLKYNNEQSEYWEKSPFLYDTSFQFIDVDFDGEDEFLYNDYYQGLAGNNYCAYDICDDGLKECDLPCRLDNFVQLNKELKALILESYSGVFEYCKAVFKKNAQESPVVEFCEGSLPENALAVRIYEDYKTLERSAWVLESLFQKYTNCNVECDEYLFENRKIILRLKDN